MEIFCLCLPPTQRRILSWVVPGREMYTTKRSEICQVYRHDSSADSIRCFFLNSDAVCVYSGAEMFHTSTVAFNGTAVSFPVTESMEHFILSPVSPIWESNMQYCSCRVTTDLDIKSQYKSRTWFIMERNNFHYICISSFTTRVEVEYLSLPQPPSWGIEPRPLWWQNYSMS